MYMEHTEVESSEKKSKLTNLLEMKYYFHGTELENKLSAFVGLQDLTISNLYQSHTSDADNYVSLYVPKNISPTKKINCDAIIKGSVYFPLDLEEQTKQMTETSLSVRVFQQLVFASDQSHPLASQYLKSLYSLCNVDKSVSGHKFGQLVARYPVEWNISSTYDILKIPVTPIKPIYLASDVYWSQNETPENHSLFFDQILSIFKD